MPQLGDLAQTIKPDSSPRVARWALAKSLKGDERSTFMSSCLKKA
ncbi:hypothetical protein FK514_27245 [Klebsiella pneumoniae]|nr:hypothetical protein [Klebsiella pneumoniae]